MKRNIQMCRGSLLSIIPAEIVQDMGLKVGDKLDFRIEDENIIATPVRTASKTSTQAAQHPVFNEGEGK